MQNKDCLKGIEYFKGFAEFSKMKNSKADGEGEVGILGGA